MNTDLLFVCETAHNAVPHPSGKEGLVHEKLTHAIIGAAFEVHRNLGYGFLEKIYNRAMELELRERGIEVRSEFPIQVCYKGTVIGDYYADLVVDSKVLVEIKVAEKYNVLDEPQLLNELRATGMKVGLLINFGPHKVEFKRMVF